ncbi:unnamed protein product [Meloidogyne enterolobii]|uniref:Uncharacterized protein n=1 Tax=Meloidogyne enterolobii TaxID=390850 RepID=A0ACB0XRK7_MELEN
MRTNLNSNNSHSSFTSQQPQVFIPENISQNQQQLSEEDNELDIGEVCRLLDESAGQRISDLEQPRRRERLSNLTMEQKLLRRKQKNRIAAQAARDRKKETNKRLEESLKRAIQEISRLRGELRFLQAQNAQLLASQNGQNDGRIVQNIPQENIVQHKPLIFPKQEILMATVEDKQQQYQYSNTNVKNFGGEQPQVMNQPLPNSVDVKSSIASHQSTTNNSLHQSSPSLKLNNLSPLNRDSLGSAASFNALLPWERESVPEEGMKKTGEVMDKMQSKLMKNNRGKMPLMASGRQQQNAVRIACLIKVFTALWSIVCEKRETAKTSKDCKISSTSFSKAYKLDCSIFKFYFQKWTFQSMWTASATKSLKKALLRRMVLMDNAKLLRLCNSPQRQLVAHLLMRTRETCNYSEEFDFGTDKQQYIHEQQHFSIERGGAEQHRVSGRGRLSHSSSAALAALSPHNYCSQPTIVQTPTFNQQTHKNYQKHHKNTNKQSTGTQSQSLYQQHQSISSSDYISDNGLLGALHEVPSPFKEEQYRQPHSIASSFSTFYNCSSNILANNTYSNYEKYQDINEECYEENVESPMLPLCQKNGLGNGDFEEYQQDPHSSFDYGLEQQQWMMDTVDDEQVLINDGDEMFYQNHPDTSFSSTNFPFLVDGLEDDSSSLQL